MSYFADIDENISDQVWEQIREFRKQQKKGNLHGWYRIKEAVNHARDYTIYHEDISNYTLPNLFDEEGTPIDFCKWGDPEADQVKMIEQHLIKTSAKSRGRGSVTEFKLKQLMTEIIERRVEEYLNPNPSMEKLKILCFVGDSGTGKTLASLHLKYHCDANVICSFTTRPPRTTEVEGRDHHFIDIVPDPSDILAQTIFGSYYYYATKWQVFGPCTVYVIDEKGLLNLKKDYGDVYDIYSVYILRDMQLRKRCEIKTKRMQRDEQRERLPLEYYDYIVYNNSTKKAFFRQIEKIYEEVKNK